MFLFQSVLFSLYVYPGVGLLNLLLVLFLIFSTTVFCIVTAPISIPTSSVGALPLLHSLLSASCLSEGSQ